MIVIFEVDNYQILAIFEPNKIGRKEKTRII